MSDLFGNHIVGFPTRRLISCTVNIFVALPSGYLYTRYFLYKLMSDISVRGRMHSEFLHKY